jgi:hypothetical protein
VPRIRGSGAGAGCSEEGERYRVTPQPRVLVIADDDPDDRLLMRDAMRESGLPHEVRTVGDGEELLEYLNRTERYAPPVSAPVQAWSSWT